MIEFKSKQKSERARSRIRNDLRYERKERGLSRKQVAKIIGLSVDSIDAYERGRRMPNLINALKLQILYRSQLASIYETIYRELTAEIRAAEESLPARGKQEPS